MKHFKNLIYLLAPTVLIFTLSACGQAKTEELSQSTTIDNTSDINLNQDSKGQDGERTGSRRMGGGGTIDKTSDTELQETISEVLEKFQVFTYEDTETGKSLDYNLFIPEEYDPSQSYPLVLFIPDSSLVSKGTEAALTQGYGGIIWATEAEQLKHQSFVLVPSYTETLTTDNWETGEEVELTVRLLKKVISQYSIDDNRLYATGQSMGCMTTMYLNIQYPDLFAASLFVGGQWDENALEVLKNEKFFYIVAQGDSKASAGMAALKPVLENAGAIVASEVWNAQWSAEEFDSAVSDLINEGDNIYFVEFEKGSVLPDGVEIGTNEHMYSFDYAYKIEGVRDWLFNQVKE